MSIPSAPQPASTSMSTIASQGVFSWQTSARRIDWLPRGLIHYPAADRLAAGHHVEGVFDLLERHGVGDEIVDIDFPAHVPIDDLGHVGAASGASEGRTDPAPPRDELERARRNLLARAGHADDRRHAPAAMTTFERLTHQRHVAEAFEAVIGPADRHRHEMRHEIALHLVRIDEMRHAEGSRTRLALRVDVDTDDHVGTDHLRALNDVQPHPAQAED